MRKNRQKILSLGGLESCTGSTVFVCAYNTLYRNLTDCRSFQQIKSKNNKNVIQEKDVIFSKNKHKRKLHPQYQYLRPSKRQRKLIGTIDAPGKIVPALQTWRVHCFVAASAPGIIINHQLQIAHSLSECTLCHLCATGQDQAALVESNSVLSALRSYVLQYASPEPVTALKQPTTTQ